jgi:hypothetical protein
MGTPAGSDPDNGNDAFAADASGPKASSRSRPAIVLTAIVPVRLRKVRRFRSMSCP